LDLQWESRRRLLGGTSGIGRANRGLDWREAGADDRWPPTFAEILSNVDANCE
jgi:hypothetical protein